MEQAPNGVSGLPSNLSVRLSARGWLEGELGHWLVLVLGVRYSELMILGRC